ncbi:MAG: WecB/TagA/CpsF family glycosyltransferase [Chthoniobacterales bacterium]
MLKTVPVLGVPVACVDYQTGLDEALRLAQLNRPSAVSACNTHLIAAARKDTTFNAIMQSFDLVLPDGMPVVWMMNREGAGLKDRVYGPYFMRYALENAPPSLRHFFFGSTESCLAELVEAAKKIRPNIVIAGAFSPPFRTWTEEDHGEHARLIAESGADFIWVALGGERQERWIIEQQTHFSRGTFFAVGDAFELLAGRRPYAPDWMQNNGLTWAYRLYQEPTRLWPRYFKYNSLFLRYLIQDTLRPVRESAPGKKIAFLGSRGVPARYAGFETVVDELGGRLVERGYNVSVYNRSNYYPEKPREHRGMRLIYIPTIRIRSTETILHTLLSSLHAMTCDYDVVYLCGVGNSCLAGLLRLGGRKLVINVDGIDYKRPKWSGFARWWLQESERWAMQLCDRVIADNLTVVEHYRKQYIYQPQYIAYGANVDVPPAPLTELEKWGLQPRNYILFVSRLSPENDADLLMRAYARSGVLLPLVIVGSHGYESEYYAQLQSLATETMIFTGAVFGEGYRALSQNCRFFVLPAAIEATRLVLLDQMGFGNAILFRESPATREVIGDSGEAFAFGDTAENTLAEKITILAGDEIRCKQLRESALQRARDIYSWDRVAEQYVQLFAGLNERTVTL